MRAAVATKKAKDLKNTVFRSLAISIFVLVAERVGKRKRLQINARPAA
jgi:hypothetical protein